MTLESFAGSRNTTLLERARAKMQDAGNRAGEAGVIASIGELDYWIAISSQTVNPKTLFVDAFRSYNEALPLMREAGDLVGEIGVLTNMGLVSMRGKMVRRSGITASAAKDG